ncbi:MAG: hypothetical protein CFH34_00239 [Alphaproteobacteria bacterium MarineAlpha9_Bin4]|nr:hypothetical protein [Pelagibacterales bacterium]PPR27410.1 MAG: hypothetical protein CFH34_00239 [Alphaproteobacteria bacterium MarineAlpha9_Bin4]|tara:strand:- start:1185 stop:1742 length:558 start_codon:yes stop_codon:yes gene_type:complete
MAMFRKFLFITVALIIIFLIVGFVRFYFSIKSYQKSDNYNIDGIAVLTGGKGRIAEGIKIFKENPESYLLISGVDKIVEIEEIIPVDFLKMRRVFIDKKSESTLENANEIITWSNKNKIKNILIITSDYHMPRSMLILSKRGDGLSFYANPVNSNIRFEKNFIKDIKLIQFLLVEYFKYLLYLVI